MRLSAVIGACYGDEGKGHAVDWLSDAGSLVVRFNGGAQAGHTVTDPDGRRHVFHHFGSGTLRGAATFLSKFYINNPVLFGMEWEELEKLKLQPRVYVDPRGMLTTPFDMIINQIMESSRGERRHGSCGVGINETVTRCEQNAWRTTAEHLTMRRWQLKEILKEIRDNYLPRRLRDLGYRDELPGYVWKEGLIDNFLDDCEFMNASVAFSETGIIRTAPHVVFEGAQGLGLDEFGPDFPHVTRSRTGLPNVTALVKEAQLDNERVDAYYLMRPYMTRHGRGPLPHELKEKPFRAIEDRTNVPNGFQEALRFGWVDVDQLGGRILLDSVQAAGLHVRPMLLMSCVDQISDRLTVFRGGKEHAVCPQELAEEVAHWAGLEGFAWFEGETRDHIKGERGLYTR